MRVIPFLLLLFFSFRAFGYEAESEIINREGKVIGKALLSETPFGVLITVELKNLPKESEMAFHIHEKGICEPPEFKSAGGHFNPENKKHGFMNQEGYHAGDMPNFFTDKEGNAKFTVLNPKITLKEGKKNSVLGLAIMIHARKDDYSTDPAGNAGPRIACGVIKKKK